jgi:hypothetical protein
MLTVVQCFGTHCSYHLQGDCVLTVKNKSVLVGHSWLTYCRTGSIGCDGADWWSRRAGYCPVGNEHVEEDKRC